MGIIILNYKKSSGFTLLEVMFTILIMSIVVYLGGGTLATILRNTPKTLIEQEVTRNGDYALSIMERMIRNATSLTCSGNHDILTVTSLDTDTTFQCYWDESAAKIVYITGGNTSPLTNKEVTLGISCNLADSTLRFYCSGNAVDISFTLYQTGVKSRPEERAQVTFSTTYSSRNY